MANSDSTRFIVQMIINVVVCNYANKKIAKIASKKQGKRTFKAYMIFLIFCISIITVNQAVFFFFKERNLYEQLEIPRSMPVDQIQNYEGDLKIKIMQMDNIPIQRRVELIKKFQDLIKVLIHPARRLSYDTFGQKDVSFAWAFKNNYFLLSTIINASIFYLMCSFLNMISNKKGEIKEVFKLQIMVMILLFLWEVELIMKTQSRLHSPTDILDKIYTAFPIFERRQMIKIILIPCMNMIKFFYRYYLQSTSQQKFLEIAKNFRLRQSTQKVSQHVNKIQVDQHLQDKIAVAISQIKKKEPVGAEIFEYQRKCLVNLVRNEGENILMDQEVAQLLRYFMIIAK